MLTAAVAAAAKSPQSCPTLCNPRDGIPPGSSVPGILQARTLEWGAIAFSNAWKWKVKVKLLSRVWLLATAWTAAYQAHLSMGFSRQEYYAILDMMSRDTSEEVTFEMRVEVWEVVSHAKIQGTSGNMCSSQRQWQRKVLEDKMSLAHVTGVWYTREEMLGN